ncbi:hypothetical protein C8F00_2800 [Xanthomonas vasicola]
MTSQVIESSVPHLCESWHSLKRKQLIYMSVPTRFVNSLTNFWTNRPSAKDTSNNN